MCVCIYNFWKSAIKCSKLLYINCFYRLRFLAEITTTETNTKTGQVIAHGLKVIQISFCFWFLLASNFVLFMVSSDFSN